MSTKTQRLPADESQSRPETQPSLAFEGQNSTEDQRMFARSSLAGRTPELRAVDLGRYVEMRRLHDIFYDVQDIRIRTANRERGMPKETFGVYSKRQRELERKVLGHLSSYLKSEPIWKEFLSKVRGIGPTLASGWVSNIMIKYSVVDDLDEATDLQKKYCMKTRDGKLLIPSIRGIVAFPTLSKLWKWCGLDVVDGRAPRRRRGEKFGRNPRMRVLCWKTMRSFLYQGEASPYYTIYKAYKERYSTNSPYAAALKDPKQCFRYGECVERMEGRAKRLGTPCKRPPCRLHIHALAARRTMKDFTKHLYLNWRKLDGLPLTEPYEIAVLKHKHERDDEEWLSTQLKAEASHTSESTQRR